jgi:hypothetical protein
MLKNLLYDTAGFFVKIFFIWLKSVFSTKSIVYLIRNNS